MNIASENTSAGFSQKPVDHVTICVGQAPWEHVWQGAQRKAGHRSGPQTSWDSVFPNVWLGRNNLCLLHRDKVDDKEDCIYVQCTKGASSPPRPQGKVFSLCQKTRSTLNLRCVDIQPVSLGLALGLADLLCWFPDQGQASLPLWFVPCDLPVRRRDHALSSCSELACLLLWAGGSSCCKSSRRTYFRWVRTDHRTSWTLAKPLSLNVFSFPASSHFPQFSESSVLMHCLLTSVLPFS